MEIFHLGSGHELGWYVQTDHDIIGPFTAREDAEYTLDAFVVGERSQRAKMTRTEMLLASYKRDLANAIETIAVRARSLSRDMQDLSIRPEYPTRFNSLGEVQSKGEEIDRLCYVIQMHQKHISQLERKANSNGTNRRA